MVMPSSCLVKRCYGINLYLLFQNLLLCNQCLYQNILIRLQLLSRVIINHTSISVIGDPNMCGGWFGVTCAFFWRVCDKVFIVRGCGKVFVVRGVARYLQ